MLISKLLSLENEFNSFLGLVLLGLRQILQYGCNQVSFHFFDTKPHTISVFVQGLWINTI